MTILPDQIATRGQVRAAFAVMVVSAAVFIGLAPFAQVKLTPVPAFISAYQAALMLLDLVTVSLLLGQYRATRVRAILCLACGYVLTTLLTLAHTFSFPGLLAPQGLLGGGSQTTAWLYMFWHGGFPIFVAAFAVTKPGRAGPGNGRRWLVGTVALAALLVVLATAAEPFLPQLMSGNGYAPPYRVVVGAVWLSSAIAFVLLWRKRPRSLLALWLMAAMCVWICEVGLAAVFNAGRFDLGFYAGRTYGLVAAGVLLVVLLFEYTELYTREVAVRESALRRTEDRLKLLMDNLNDYAVVVLDLQGMIVEWQAGAQRITGFTAAQAIGRTCHLFYTPQDVAAGAIEQEMRIAAQSGQALDKRWHQKVDGGRFYADGVMVPLRGDAGELLGFGKLFRDATDQRLAQEALRVLTQESDRRKRLYETILSNTPDLAYVFDLNHRFSYANEVLLRIWGRSWDQAIGKTFLDLGYEPWHAEMHGREIEQVKATRRPVRGEVPFTGTAGRRIYEYIFMPVLGPGGEVEAIAGTTRDVTERKASEDETHRLYAQLKDEDRRKDEFLATLAHELRNPLAPVRTGLEVLKRSTSPESNSRIRAMMERQVTHMARLIDDLLDVSRITSGTVRLQNECVALSTVVDAAIEVSRPLIDADRHELTVSLAPQPAYVEGDPTRLAQVVSNLLNNAAKYTPAGGRIELSVEPDGPHAVLRVRDNGVGIAADKLPHVFELFTQVGKTLDRSQGGLGIGLAIVQRMVQMHGGTVQGESAGPGEGSTFTVRLPLAPVPLAASTSGNSKQEVSPPLRTKRILVVDDNVDAADALRALLALAGHQIQTVHTGLHAIEEARTFEPDVVLLDIGLPGMNGYEVAERLRALATTRGAMLVALTGWGADHDKRRAMEAGFDQHLTKPVEISRLEALIAVHGRH